jgi:hypothetical protein
MSQKLEGKIALITGGSRGMVLQSPSVWLRTELERYTVFLLAVDGQHRPHGSIHEIAFLIASQADQLVAFFRRRLREAEEIPHFAIDAVAQLVGADQDLIGSEEMVGG